MSFFVQLDTMSFLKQINWAKKHVNKSVRWTWNKESNGAVDLNLDIHFILTKWGEEIHEFYNWNMKKYIKNDNYNVWKNKTLANALKQPYSELIFGMEAIGFI